MNNIITYVAYLLAVVVGVGTLWIAVINSRIKISEFRQNWINQVRTLFVQFNRELDIYFELAISTDNPSAPRDNESRKQLNIDIPLKHETLNRLKYIREEIKLYLNPKEEIYKELLLSMKNSVDHILVITKPGVEDNYLENAEKLVSKQQEL
ncbi:MAG: hypothetical protein GY866_31705, partial [Proteobacteria bacterium]|nr:hypothetical protein [Pseudomonadota bacterium]